MRSRSKCLYSLIFFLFFRFFLLGGGGGPFLGPFSSCPAHLYLSPFPPFLFPMRPHTQILTAATSPTLAPTPDPLSLTQHAHTHTHTSTSTSTTPTTASATVGTGARVEGAGRAGIDGEVKAGPEAEEAGVQKSPSFLTPRIHLPSPCYSSGFPSPCY